MTLKTLQLTGEEKQHRALIAETVNEVIKGRCNNTGTFTLTANSATTTVADVAFESAMVPLWVPTTANAAAALTNVRLTTRNKGSFVLTHTNTATTDRTYLYTRQG